MTAQVVATGCCVWKLMVKSGDVIYPASTLIYSLSILAFWISGAFQELGCKLACMFWHKHQNYNTICDKQIHWVLCIILGKYKIDFNVESFHSLSRGAEHIT